MIKFALICDQKHRFESWFQSGAAFDRQVEDGLITCPYCDSVQVAKAIMAPAIARGATPPGQNVPCPGSQTAPQNLETIEASPSLPTGQDDGGLREALEHQRELRRLVIRLHEEIHAHAENVGDRFVEEVHKIKDGVLAPRPIYGQASVEEARDLIDEGIEILPLPSLPDEWN
ncbi:DUF1178 family protein [Beijerinckia indica]|uniref:DUF1178 family protein n=1 Tax=Beijerinckia indica subsp. indica (strain ATCC 9039 / DSM 1715 / NCIMB 8712) TaxID=395963 RepID=B2IDT6_BEII9|nr:DUF1178 family protein [Beijerinckia indica]ACB96868.1 protein of unknown function DUF1178 [Beijerinckia indica subsp. indica ATCC 9039]